MHAAAQTPLTVHTQVAAGPAHAVMLTMGGEVYAWGNGGGGRLGLGHANDAPTPERIHTLWGQPVKHLAACGACHSCTWQCFERVDAQGIRESTRMVRPAGALL